MRGRAGWTCVAAWLGVADAAKCVVAPRQCQKLWNVGGELRNAKNVSLKKEKKDTDHEVGCTVVHQPLGGSGASSGFTTAPPHFCGQWRVCKARKLKNLPKTVTELFWEWGTRGFGEQKTEAERYASRDRTEALVMSSHGSAWQNCVSYIQSELDRAERGLEKYCACRRHLS